MVIYVNLFCCVFFFKQKTAYEMRISDWSSDVCSSDLRSPPLLADAGRTRSKARAPARELQHDARLTRGALFCCEALPLRFGVLRGAGRRLGNGIGRPRHVQLPLPFENWPAEVARQRGAELRDISLAFRRAVERGRRRLHPCLAAAFSRSVRQEANRFERQPDRPGKTCRADAGEIGRASCRERVCQYV